MREARPGTAAHEASPRLAGLSAVVANEALQGRRPHPRGSHGRACRAGACATLRRAAGRPARTQLCAASDLPDAGAASSGDLAHSIRAAAIGRVFRIRPGPRRLAPLHAPA